MFNGSPIPIWIDSFLKGMMGTKSVVIISSKWPSILKTSPDPVDELINLRRYFFPFWKTLLNIGLRSSAGTHGSVEEQFVKFPVK